MKSSISALDIRRGGAFRTIYDVKANSLPLCQSLEAIITDRGEVDEYVLTTVIRGNETETLRLIEPFDSTF
jgi:hypothetical protein